MQIRTLLLLGAFLALLISCAAAEQMQSEPHSETPAEEPAIQKTVAVLHPAEGFQAKGVVTFETQNGSIKVVADLEGLNPGDHGFHIHELGDCSAPDATSAGGHFNPTGQPHGAPADQKRHVGDLGNITIDDSGRGHYERVDELISLKGPHSIIGRAVILHEVADDLSTQPTGGAGARVACGVIGIAKP